jgi:crotonobetainyl-CoA:carnitine CoA-transferase CaiB-like acyl-CoA transferase
MWNDANHDEQTGSVAQLGPLAGLRVIDLTVALAGPYCTLLLAGLGAEVIKIEAPGGSDIARNNPPYVGGPGLNYNAPAPGEVSLSMLDRHRNKKSITLDLKASEGRDLFLELVKKADVLVENFSIGTMERLSIDYATLSTINPGLIYTSVSSLGQDAPPAIKGMDIIVQAMSGVMEVTGFADGPPCRVGFPLADILAPHYALSGIMAAIIHRGRSGRGQRVDISMVDCLTSLLAMEHFDILVAAGESARTGNNQDRLTPFGIYKTSDSYVAIAAPQDAWTHAMFRAMGQPELANDERFRMRGGRAIHAKILNGIIETWTSSRSTEAVVSLLLSHGVTAAAVRTPGQAFADPGIRQRGAVVTLRHPMLPEGIETATAGVPIQFSDCRAGYDQQAPMLGDHNPEIYGSLLGLSETQIQDLKARAII